MWNYICPECGAHLDPSEECDCAHESIKKAPVRVEVSTSASEINISLSVYSKNLKKSRGCRKNV